MKLFKKETEKKIEEPTPKCPHFYSSVCVFPDELHCSGVVSFKCQNCGEIISLDVTRDVMDFIRGGL